MPNKNIKARMEQDVPDNALSVKDMLDGKELTFIRDFLKQGKTQKEFKKFDGFFKALEERAEIAKALVLVDGYETLLKALPTTPEQEFISQIDSMLSKMEARKEELLKTNLPAVSTDTDSVAELTEDEKQGEERNE